MVTPRKINGPNIADISVDSFCKPDVRINYSYINIYNTYILVVALNLLQSCFVFYVEVKFVR
jgi:hypothetical protein